MPTTYILLLLTISTLRSRRAATTTPSGKVRIAIIRRSKADWIRLVGWFTYFSSRLHLVALTS